MLTVQFQSADTVAGVALCLSYALRLVTEPSLQEVKVLAVLTESSTGSEDWEL